MYRCEVHLSHHLHFQQDAIQSGTTLCISSTPVILLHESSSEESRTKDDQLAGSVPAHTCWFYGLHTYEASQRPNLKRHAANTYIAATLVSPAMLTSDAVLGKL